MQGVSGRAYYFARIGDFLGQHNDTVVAALTMSSQFDITPAQKAAWLGQIGAMRSALTGSDPAGLIAFEFAVPRMGKRIDVLVVTQGVVFVIEFKVGEREFHADAANQVWDYALDLKNFHSTTHTLPVVPILVATEAAHLGVHVVIESDHDGVVRPLRANSGTLRAAMSAAVAWCRGTTIDSLSWAAGSYKPTPTIIEAAMALYGRHKVEDISRQEAGAINLTQTSATVERIIHDARANRHKAICFVTGVPGAGKTLVGLNTATTHVDNKSELYSVYLSGNGPLVRILCEALARDKVARSKLAGKPIKLGEARTEVKAFIQNVHHFRDECLREGRKPPAEHVALFDEAQRAWNLHQTAGFMKRKKGHANFAMSSRHS